MNKTSTMLVALALAATAMTISTPTLAQEDACSNSLDILFVFDTTGSMGGVLSSAKAGATDIMNNIQALVPNTNFAVADYRDYPGTYFYPGYGSFWGTTYGGSSDYPWKLHSGLDGDTANVQSALDGVSLGWGADGPESLTRAIYESHADSNIGWRADSTKIAVFFSDAPPHDSDFAGNNYGGDPGRNGIGGDGDDLDFETEVANLAAAGIQAVTINSNSWNPSYAAAYLSYMASQTGGAYAQLSGDFVGQITDLILGLIPDADAEAYNLYVDVRQNTGAPELPGQVLIDRLNQRVAPSDSSGSVAGVDLADFGVELHAGTLESTVSATPIEAVSAASAAVQGFSLTVGGDEILSATAIEGAANSGSLRHSASAGATTLIAGLMVAGEAVEVPADPNTVIELPEGLGQVVLNEQSGATGTSTAWAAVNAIHATVDLGAGNTLEVIVSHAFAGSKCFGDANYGDPALGGYDTLDAASDAVAETTAPLAPVTGPAEAALAEALATIEASYAEIRNQIPA
ncbi:MAG: choice-of-anchor P family protein [Thermoplasmatota archaeon]